MLQRFAEPGFPGDRAEELENGHAVKLSGFLGVENEVVGVWFSYRKPRFQYGRLVEQTVALDLQKVLCRVEGAFQPCNVNLLGVEIDVRNPQIRNLLRSGTMSHSKEKHRVLAGSVCLRSLQKAFKLLARQV